MSSERVEKQWKDKGLSGYSTAAILGSLNHYGVAIDEAAFKAQGLTQYPLQLAGSWKPSWKGTGQFLAFPYAAAEELMRRLLPERKTPMQAADAVIRLMAGLARRLAGGADEVGPIFEELEGMQASLPTVGDQRDAFLTEFVGFIDSFGRAFSDLPMQLAQAGQKDDALRFARIQEALFPERAGCVTALVRASSGERDEAVGELVKHVGDDSKDLYARYSGLDVLHQLGAVAEVKALGVAFCDEVIAAEKWRLADTVVHMLAHALSRQATREDAELMRGIEERHALVVRHVGGH